MPFFDKLKSEAVGAARRTSGSISQQVSGTVSGIFGNAAGESWRVAFEDKVRQCHMHAASGTQEKVAKSI